MGGNSRAVDENGDVVLFNGRRAYADKINLYVIEREDLVKDLRELLHALNAAFETDKGYPLWNFKRTRKIFNGSSAFLFDESISDSEFRRTKSELGDIDLMIPAAALHDLWDVLKKNEKKRIGQFVYLGNNKVNRSSIVAQINAVFWYKPQDSFSAKHVQIDFEGVDFENEAPTIWSRFSHSANWDDMKCKVKGVAHKLLLQSIANVMGRIPNSIELTLKSPITDPVELKSLENDLFDLELQEEKNEKKIAELKNELKRKKPRVPKGCELRDVSSLTFSVLYGVRNKMQPQFLSNGDHYLVHGKKAYKAIPTGESKYLNKPNDIFQAIFKRSPSPQEENKLWSFFGLLDLIATEEPKTLRLIRDEFVRRLWGFTPEEAKDYLDAKDIKSAAQALERDDWKLDFATKSTALGIFMETFPDTKLSDEVMRKIILLYYGKDGKEYSRRCPSIDDESNPNEN